MTTADEAPVSVPVPAWRRVLVFSIATLVVLLVGAVIGMLITRAATGGGAPSPGSVDVGFTQDMRVHHLQAVTMAGITRDRTTDPQVHSLAFDIESTQIAQASQMEGWLTVWERPTLPDAGSGHMAWMAGSGHAHGTATNAAGGVAVMPGMATTAELNRLRSASGKELDILFLQLMLRHHQGALPMAGYAADRAATGYVRDLARKIVAGQNSEVSLMTQLLADRGASPLPAPN